MTDVGYVAAGYAVTVVALVGYALSLIARTRRARRRIEEEAGRR